MSADSIRIARVADHSFVAAPISPQSVVVDLGVNEGEFAIAMIERFGCSVIGLEPVPYLFSALPQLSGLTVESLAITAGASSARLHINSSSTAATTVTQLSDSTAPTVEVEGITLAGLLDRHGVVRASLVKVDIEGAEIEMLDDASLETLQRVDQFTIEFHDFLTTDLAAGVRRAKQRLRSAGFAELSLSGDNSDVLFVNRARISFSPVHRAAAALAYKYPRGLRRKLDRRRRRPRAT